MAEPTNPLLVTREELAARLGVAPGTVDNYRRLGLIPEPLPGTKRWFMPGVSEHLRRRQCPEVAVAETAQGTGALDAWRAQRGRTPR